MRCVHCQNDAKYKDRSDGKCPACHHAFVFEPRNRDRFTDMGFQAAINRVSGNGTVKFHESNLYYELKKVKKGPGAAVGVVGFAGVVSTALFVGHAYLLGGALAAAGVAAGALANAARRTHRGLLPNDFTAAYARWRRANGEPPGLIARTKLTGRVPAAELQAELESYSFDRAVITDSAETAELLLANDFHFENNCAVLSVDGSPAHAFEPVRRMLRKNPRLEVFALHDCTAGGCTLAFRLKHDPAWFKELGTVYDVALRPSQARAKSLAALREPSAGQGRAHPAITAAEAAWLGQWNLRLAAIRPEQLIKRLYRSMQSPAQADGGTQGSDWSTDASASDGGADSFG